MADSDLSSEQGNVSSQSKGVTAAGSEAVRRRRLIVRGVAAALVVITLAILIRALLTPAQSGPAANAGAAGKPGAPAPLVGHYAPDVSLLTLSGQHVSLASLRGKVVILNFWYVACEPCRYEMPALEKAYEQHQSQGLVVVGLDITDDASTISPFVHDLGITYPIWRDANQNAVVTYRLTATPSSFVIDRQGVIRYKAVGPLDTATIKTDVTPLLH